MNFLKRCQKVLRFSNHKNEYVAVQNMYNSLYIYIYIYIKCNFIFGYRGVAFIFLVTFNAVEFGNK